MVRARSIKEIGEFTDMQLRPRQFFYTVVFCLVQMAMADFTHGQTLLGSSGGFEGSFTIDNSTLATNGGADTWQKGNANQTITLETTTVRSGANSLKILNTSTTGRRVYTPLLASVADGSRLVLQYYRRRPTGTGQEDQRGIAFPPESTSGTYSSASAVDTWEKVTYVPTATTTNGNKWAAILHRLVTTGDNTLPEYLDDVAVYTPKARADLPMT